jgi:CRP-like cAMP-binding protein
MPTFGVFEGLSKKETSRIFDVGVILPIEEGKILFHKGDIGHEMYLVLTGKIDIYDEYDTGSKTGTERLAELRPGELFGEMAMFETSHKRSAHALASEPSQLLVLSEETINKFIEKKVPRRFLANIISLLCRRLRVTNSMYMRAKYGDKLAEENE